MPIYAGTLTELALNNLLQQQVIIEKHIVRDKTKVSFFRAQRLASKSLTDSQITVNLFGAIYKHSFNFFRKAMTATYVSRYNI